MLKANNVTK